MNHLAGTRENRSVPSSVRRAPTTWSKPSSSLTSIGISSLGYVMSTSVHTTTRPRAAVVPVRRAAPEPRLWGWRIRRMPSIVGRSTSEPSFEPSSTTMISNEYGDAVRAVRMRSISVRRWPRSL